MWGRKTPGRCFSPGYLSSPRLGRTSSFDDSQEEALLIYGGAEVAGGLGFGCFDGLFEGEPIDEVSGEFGVVGDAGEGSPGEGDLVGSIIGDMGEGVFLSGLRGDVGSDCSERLVDFSGAEDAVVDVQDCDFSIES